MRYRVGPWILIFIGVVFLANNLGVLSLHELKPLLAKWWPAILIVVGVAGVLGLRGGRSGRSGRE